MYRPYIYLLLVSKRLDGVEALHLSVTCERLEGVETLHLSVTSEIGWCRGLTSICYLSVRDWRV